MWIFSCFVQSTRLYSYNFTQFIFFTPGCDWASISLVCSFFQYTVSSLLRGLLRLWPLVDLELAHWWDTDPLPNKTSSSIRLYC